MRRRVTVLLLFGATIAVTLLSYLRHVGATAQSGVSTLITAKSTLAPFEVFNHAVVPNPKGDGDNDRDDKMLWLSMQATRGSSDFYIVNNTLGAGGPDDKSRGHHGLALSPWSQPDRRHRGNSDGL